MATLPTPVVVRGLLAIAGYVLIIFGLALGLDTFIFAPQRRAMPLVDEDGLVIAPWEAPPDAPLDERPERPEDAA